MPVEEIDLELPFAGWQVMAVMFWPDDQLARNNFLVTVAADVMQRIQHVIPENVERMLPDIARKVRRPNRNRAGDGMRQTHVAGDKAFVDFSGKKMPIIDPITGSAREAEIFVAVLGASNLTYAEATWTQGLPDWIGAHVRMFRFWGARPRLLVPDNLRSGVHKASFYDPEINRSYGAMAAHYGVGFTTGDWDDLVLPGSATTLSICRAAPARRAMWSPW